MITLTIPAVLYIITGILHLSMPLRFRSNPATRPVAAFGVIYLILGTLLLLGISGSTPVIALILTLIGVAGAIATLNTSQELRNSNLFLIGIDVVIIVVLAIHVIAT